MELETKCPPFRTNTEAKWRCKMPPSVSIPVKFEPRPCVCHQYQRLPAPSADDVELVCLKSSTMYTSLKDLLPYSPPSLLSPNPTSLGGASPVEIAIRNHLVKQAAWAYLQPMSTSPSAAGPALWSGDFVRLRVWVCGARRAMVDWAARACECLVDPFWLILCICS